MGVTRELAVYICDRPVDSLEAVEQARRGLLDLLGVAMLGAREDASIIVERVVRDESGPGAAAVLSSAGLRLAPAAAALVNGTAAHALDYDDIGLGVGHPSAVIVPAALAVAEHVGATGEQLLHAMVIGYEIAHRFASLPPDSLSGPYARGYHGTSLYGVFGATAASARLLGLSHVQTAHALGLATSSSAGLRVNFGTMTKPFHAGSASSAGVRGALLAEQGFTACVDAIEDPFGWFDVIGRSGELVTMTEALDGRFAIEGGLWFKSFPCCGANHYSIDGLLFLMRQHRLSADDVARVDVTVHQRYLDEVLVYEWPETGLQGKFCLAYNIVAALIDRRVDLRTFRDSRLTELAAHRDRVVVHGSLDIDRHDAIVRVATVDGRVLEAVTIDGDRPVTGRRVLHGIEIDPLTWDELVTKFSDNVVESIGTMRARAVALLVKDMHNEASLSRLTNLLTH